MKNVILIILFLPIFSVGQIKSLERRKTTLIVDSINNAKIGKYLKKPKKVIDSIIVFSNYKTLNSEQIKYFVEQWNNATYVGEKKVKPKYIIELNMKNGTLKTIKINNTLCEKNIFQFSLKDKKFIDELWEND